MNEKVCTHHNNAICGQNCVDTLLCQHYFVDLDALVGYIRNPYDDTAQTILVNLLLRKEEGGTGEQCSGRVHFY